jgi:hypothetical protein
MQITQRIFFTEASESLEFPWLPRFYQRVFRPGNRDKVVGNVAE